MRTYKLRIEDQDYEVEVKTFSLKEATLVVNGKKLQVKVSDVLTTTSTLVQPETSLRSAPATPSRESKARVAERTEAASAGGNAVTAPIPGAVLSVEVSEGETVEAGQLLAKMEAMKMENQIKSPRTGKVVKVCVSPGDALAQGAELFIIE